MDKRYPASCKTLTSKYQYDDAFLMWKEGKDTASICEKLNLEPTRVGKWVVKWRNEASGVLVAESDYQVQKAKAKFVDLANEVLQIVQREVIKISGDLNRDLSVKEIDTLTKTAKTILEIGEIQDSRAKTVPIKTETIKGVEDLLKRLKAADPYIDYTDADRAIIVSN